MTKKLENRTLGRLKIEVFDLKKKELRKDFGKPLQSYIGSATEVKRRPEILQAVE